MRKRIVIGVVALVIGGGIAIVWRPWETAVEYHKRGYVNSLKTQTWRDQVSGVWNRLRGKSQSLEVPVGWEQMPTERQIKQREKHERALIELGYLEERVFVVTNRPPRTVLEVARDQWYATFLFPDKTETNLDSKAMDERLRRVRQIILRTEVKGSNSFLVVAPREHMRRWEDAVRNADVITPPLE